MIIEMIKEYFEPIEEMSGKIPSFAATIFLIMFIFINNAVKSFATMILGLFLGFFPLIFVTFNGMLLGIVAFSEVEKSGLVPFLAGILPHGIIEIPAVVISVGVGFKLAHEVYKVILTSEGNIRKEIARGISIFIHLVLPMLMAAAIIEVLITPMIYYSVTR